MIGVRRTAFAARPVPKAPEGKRLVLSHLKAAKMTPAMAEASTAPGCGFAFSA